MTRIRYTRNQFGVIQTKFLVLGQNFIVRAVIYPDKSFSIFNTENELVVSGISKTTRAAKSKVKKLLKEYGLKVDDEIRRRN